MPLASHQMFQQEPQDSDATGHIEFSSLDQLRRYQRGEKVGIKRRVRHHNTSDAKVQQVLESKASHRTIAREAGISVIAVIKIRKEHGITDFDKPPKRYRRVITPELVTLVKAFQGGTVEAASYFSMARSTVRNIRNGKYDPKNEGADRKLVITTRDRSSFRSECDLRIDQLHDSHK